MLSVINKMLSTIFLQSLGIVFNNLLKLDRIVHSFTYTSSCCFYSICNYSSSNHSSFLYRVSIVFLCSSLMFLRAVRSCLALSFFCCQPQGLLMQLQSQGLAHYILAGLSLYLCRICLDRLGRTFLSKSRFFELTLVSSSISSERKPLNRLWWSF